ncbi:ferredoxin [Williamsia sp. R60]
MRLSLDRNKCVGHAQCFAADPDRFPIDDEGYSLVADQEVDPADTEAVRSGVNACPERALGLDVP